MGLKTGNNIKTKDYEKQTFAFNRAWAFKP